MNLEKIDTVLLRITCDCEYGFLVNIYKQREDGKRFAKIECEVCDAKYHYHIKTSRLEKLSE